ncbi:hypothetical protein LPJ53_001834, partial [Coemansia erecta]
MMWTALRRPPAACPTCSAPGCSTACTSSRQPTPPRQFAHRTHTLSSFPASTFCAACQRNQELVIRLLAAHEPADSSDEDAALERYAARLRKRYPVACRRCQEHVDKELVAQAKRMWRRQLAGALKRSERGRRGRAAWEVRPTLRRKRLVAAWVCAAGVALAACFAAWSAYYWALCGRPAGFLWACALATLVARHINPLWLHVAGHPGVRIRGLPAYRRRLGLLALWRLLAFLLGHYAARALAPAVWALVAAGDVAGCLWALSCLRTHAPGGVGQRQRQRQPLEPAGSAGEEGSAAGGPGARVDAGEAIAAFGGLSFGPSEANRDQDDSRVAQAPGLSPASRWGRRP